MRAWSPNLRTCLVVAVLVAVVAGCGAPPSPSPTDAPSSSSSSPATSDSGGPTELTRGGLPAGTYTRAGFRPAITFTIDDGWAAGTLTDGFFDVQQEPGTPDVIAVQFALVEGVVGTAGAMADATTAAAAADAVATNPGLVVLGESESRLGGLDGRTIEVENPGPTTTLVMQVAPGTLAFDPGRRLWISLFDTPEGLLAVMVGGSVARWDDALTAAEPVLESVIIGG